MYYLHGWSSALKFDSVIRSARESVGERCLSTERLGRQAPAHRRRLPAAADYLKRCTERAVLLLPHAFDQICWDQQLQACSTEPGLEGAGHRSSRPVQGWARARQQSSPPRSQRRPFNRQRTRKRCFRCIGVWACAQAQVSSDSTGAQRPSGASLGHPFECQGCCRARETCSATREPTAASR